MLWMKISTYVVLKRLAQAYLAVSLFMSTGYKLKLPRETESLTEECLHPIDQRVWLWGILCIIAQCTQCQMQAEGKSKVL